MHEIFSGLLYTVAAAAIAFVARKVVSLVTAWITSVEGDSLVAKSKLAKIGLETAEKAIKTAAEVTVGKLEELTGKELRQKVKNGEADISELQALAGEALEEIKKTVKPELLELLAASLEDVELYIQNVVESQVGILKRK